eukprot:g872.t1
MEQNGKGQAVEDEQPPPPPAPTSNAAMAMKPPDAQPMQTALLEKVIGSTAESNAAFAVNPVTGFVAYPAGRTVVIFDPRSNRQVHFIHVGERSVSCVAWSNMGDLLAVDPNLYRRGNDHKQVAALQHHRFGVAAVAFHPQNSAVLVSAGFKHDRRVAMWKWQSDGAAPYAVGVPKRVIRSLCFVPDTDSHSERNSEPRVCTAGTNGQLVIWHVVEAPGDHARQLHASPVGLPASFQQEDFVSVDAVDGSMHALTSNGILSCVNFTDMVISKWVDLSTPSAFAMSVGSRYLAVGCAAGIVRLFRPESLHYVATLPSPPSKNGLKRIVSADENASDATTVPDALCVSLTGDCLKAFVFYSDRSMIAWGIADAEQAAVLRSSLSHSACIWDVVIPSATTAHLQQELELRAFAQVHGLEEPQLEHPLPPSAFITCSADRTVRIWDMSSTTDGTQGSAMSSPGWRGRGTSLSRELKHIIRFDGSNQRSVEDPKSMQRGEKDSGNGSQPPHDMDGGDSEGMETFKLNNAGGVRCIAVSVDGAQLASADRVGNITVHNLETMKKVTTLPHAHSAEVLSLSYVPVTPPKVSAPSPKRGGAQRYSSPQDMVTSDSASLLASGGRDRLVKIFDARREYKCVASLNNHSASVMAVRFDLEGSRLFSCGGDRTIVISRVKQGAGAEIEVSRDQSVASSQFGTIYDMQVHANNRWLVTAGQEKRVHIWSTFSGKKLRSWKPANAPGSREDSLKEIELNRIHLDATGTYAATCSFDKSIRIYDFLSGECVAKLSGHGELVTGVHFSADFCRLISVGGDGCIFIWRLPDAMAKAMRDRKNEMLQKKVKQYMKAKEENQRILEPKEQEEKKEQKDAVSKEDMEWLAESADALASIPPERAVEGDVDGDDNEEEEDEEEEDKGGQQQQQQQEKKKEKEKEEEEEEEEEDDTSERYSLDAPDPTMRAIMDEAAAAALAEMEEAVDLAIIRVACERLGLIHVCSSDLRMYVLVPVLFL